MFLWRALSGALAVADRLNTRGMNVASICRLCQAGDETINHVMFRCPMAQEVWRKAAVPEQLLNFSMTLEENIGILLDLLES